MNDRALAETRAWVDRAVIGLNLCPFAKAVQARNQVRYVVSDAGTAEALLVEAARERLASRASFLAQPDPLNTMAGVDRARFIDPPHRSQAAGPGADIPWITSTT